MGASERDFDREFEACRRQLDSSVIAVLERFKKANPVFGRFKLGHRHDGADFDNHMLESYSWDLQHNRDFLDHVLFVELRASKTQFMRTGVFEPALHAGAYVYENPSWGSMLTYGPVAGEDVEVPFGDLDTLQEALDSAAQAIFG